MPVRAHLGVLGSHVVQEDFVILARGQADVGFWNDDTVDSAPRVLQKENSALVLGPGPISSVPRQVPGGT